MKIGVLGTGDVGQVLGAGLATRGHEVMIGSRDPESEKVSTGGIGGWSGVGESADEET